jgi:uncharacterized protein
VDLIVVAKEPIAGRVKTRLCPPCTPRQACELAAAALADTLAAALTVGADRVILALDGRPGPWLDSGVTVVDQGSGTLARRLARAWSHCFGPAVQIGMDTPQVTAGQLGAAALALFRPDTDAVLGPAADGGWWAVGLRRPDLRLFEGVAMSRSDTGQRQRERLDQLGYRTATLPVLRDVDDYDDALAVAALAPTTRFAQTLAELSIEAA